MTRRSLTLWAALGVTRRRILLSGALPHWSHEPCRRLPDVRTTARNMPHDRRTNTMTSNEEVREAPDVVFVRRTGARSSEYRYTASQVTRAGFEAGFEPGDYYSNESIKRMLARAPGLQVRFIR